MMEEGKVLRSGKVVVGQETDGQASLSDGDQDVVGLIASGPGSVSIEARAQAVGTSPSTIAKTTVSSAGSRMAANLSPGTRAPDFEEQLFAKYSNLGMRLGLKDEALARYTAELVEKALDRHRQDVEREAERKEREAERKEREAERKERVDKENAERQERAEQRKSEMEIRRRELNLQLTKHQDEKADRSREIDVLSTRLAELRPSGTLDPFKVHIDPFDDRETTIEKFLQQFEKIANSHKWKKDIWARRLHPLLRGRARDVYLALNTEQSEAYDTLKGALLEEYRCTGEYYRLLFRGGRKSHDETFKQFANRLCSYWDSWMSMERVDQANPNELKQVLLLEQLYSSMTPELGTYVRERNPKTIRQAAEYAYEHIENKKAAQTSSGMMPKPKPTPNKKWEEGNKKTGDGRPTSKDVKCFNCGKMGHMRKDCRQPAKIKTMRSDNKETDESPGHAFLCDGCAKIPFPSVINVRVNGKETKGCRDTGADDIFVHPYLVKPTDYTGQLRRVEMADRRFTESYPVANVNFDSPYLKGKVTVLVIDNLKPDVYIGQTALMKSGQRIPVPVYPRKELTLGGVTTRAQSAKEKEGQAAIITPGAASADVQPEELRRLQQEDPSLRQQRAAANENKIWKSGHSQVKFKYSRGILKRVYTNQRGTFSQVCVPKKLREQVMRLAHDTPMSGHMGANRTKERIWSEFYWPGMCAGIRRFVQSCDRCQKVTPKGRVAKVPVGKMPTIDTPFHRVAVDLVGPIKPASEDKHRYILVMVDYATRYPEATPLRSIDTATVAEALWDMWTRVGIPKEVLSDRGGQFTGEMMKEVQDLLGIKGLATTPYHAQCNGLVERFNGTLKAMLKKMCQEEPSTWNRYIPAILFAYREVPQESTGFSPFELLYGRTVRGPMAILRDMWTKEEQNIETKTTAAYVLELRDRIEQTCKMAQEQLAKASSRYKRYFDAKARKRTFKPGDEVLLLLPTKRNKMQLAWQGPYRVSERVGECDYRISIKNKDKLFHANLLKLYFNQANVVASLSVIQEEDDDECWENVQETKQDIPTIPLTAEESVEDIHLDPETPELHEAIKELVANFYDVLTDVPLRTNLAKCNIKVESDQPIRTRQYPLPFSKREKIQEEVDAMLKMGVIEPANSPYSSPIVLITKKDGKQRFCVDFRQINRVVTFDAEPMPDMEYLFARLNNARYLTKIDLSKGYWQVPLEESDKPKTAFTTPEGQYQWTVMPFGLKTAGAVFSRMMRRLLKPLGRNEISNFIDDILIATETIEQHLDCLEALLHRLREVKLSARPSKCFMGFQQLEYLGHVVGRNSIRPTTGKMEEIKNAPRPKTKTQMRSFLGLAGFYRRFVPNFAEIALPLTEATKKKCPTNVKWSEDMEAAFNNLKESLCTEPICRLPDAGRQFVLRTDASDVGLGAILLQDWGDGLQPVACASKKLTPAEQNYSTIEKECLGIVWGIRKYSPYLFGQTFKVQCDHHPLQYLQQMRGHNQRLMRWSLTLQPYDFTIQAIPGKDNVGADYLSRLN